MWNFCLFRDKNSNIGFQFEILLLKQKFPGILQTFVRGTNEFRQLFSH